MEERPVFVKLGGSVITDKTRPQTARPEVIARLAGEMARARAARPDVCLLAGHGSGSFGHSAARRYGTRAGVRTAGEWRGFAEVATVAARLNRLVADALQDAGLPVWSLQPSASAVCRGGELLALAVEPIREALAHGVVPLVHGDVALDQVLGGTIISTEQIFAYLARFLRPARLIMVAAVDGVFDADPMLDPAARPIPRITAANWHQVRAALGGSHGTDVTGGMLAKVEEMRRLARDVPGATVQILSGLRPGALEAALSEPGAGGGTVIDGN